MKENLIHCSCREITFRTRTHSNTDTHTHTTQRDQSDESKENAASEQTCDAAQEEIRFELKEGVSVQVTHR